MHLLSPRYDPAAIESEAWLFWASRPNLFARDGEGGEPRVLQFPGTVAAADPAAQVLARAVAADAGARYLAQAGARPRGTLWMVDQGSAGEGVLPLLRRAGIATEGGRVRPLTEAVGPQRLQEVVDRLAARRLLVSRSTPLRTCPSCRLPRSPEGIVYAEAPGPAYLVRFPIAGAPPRTSLLVWTDSLWKLLGTTAILVHPTMPYVTARYRRRGVEERIVILRSAIDRVIQWLDGAEIEVLEEAPGRRWAGTAYVHPLAMESPVLANLPPPAGTVLASAEVGDSGTGVIALVPAHGAADYHAAAALGIPGWSVADLSGRLTEDVAHKYQRLTLEDAEAFVLRDVTESGLLFAQLRVRRGIPHCVTCGSALHWDVGRAWCLAPNRLSPQRTALYQRLLPDAPEVGASEVVPWPVSAGEITSEPDAPALSECQSCGELAPSDAPDRCGCGGVRLVSRRHLLPPVHAAVVAWAAAAPVAPADSAWLYLPERRRAPALVHHLLAMEAVDADPKELKVATIPTLPSSEVPARPGLGESADALRAALLLTERAPRNGELTLVNRREQEDRRLRKSWETAREILERFAAERFDPDAAVVTRPLEGLTEEDRAFLSLFERMRLEVLRLYDRGELAAAHERLAQFMEEDLRAGYLPLAGPRLASAGPSSGKAAALNVLGHVLPRWVELSAPILPFTMEAIHRALRGDHESVFERTFAPVQEALLDANAERAYGVWRELRTAVARYRRELKVAPSADLPPIVVYLNDEETAGLVRDRPEILARIAGAASVQIASPARPWDARRVEASPNLERIRARYGPVAGRIARLLEQLTGTQIQDGLKDGRLEVVLDGLPYPIAATMVDLTESLPEGVVAVPRRLGELLLRPPGASGDATGGAPPPLTPDGFRLFREVHRQLGRLPQPSLVSEIAVQISGPLAAELERLLPSLGPAFGGVPVRLVPSGEPVPEGWGVEGRTRRGDRWRCVLVGAPAAPARHKVRPRRDRRPRVRPRPPAPAAWEGTDYLDESLRARESAIRDAVTAFDTELRRPVLGPTKLAMAWEAGLGSYEEIAHAPFERLAPIPGFGPEVAALLVEHFGGPSPPRPLRPRVVVCAPSGAQGPAPVAAPSPAPPQGEAAAEDPVAPRAAPRTAPMPVPVLPPPVGVPPAPAEPTGIGPGTAPAPPAPVLPALTPADPAAARSPTPAAPAVLPPRTGVEVWPERSPGTSWSEFLAATELPRRGLCLSRDFPDRLRASLGPRAVEVVWLSNVRREGSFPPTDLAALTELFRRAFGERGVEAAYLEGVEYLVRIHTAERTAAFLEGLADMARHQGARILVPVNPDLVDPTTFARLHEAFPSGRGDG